MEGKKECSVCRSANVETIIEIENIPVFCNVLYKTKEEAINTAKGNIALTFCSDCGHIYNKDFKPELLEYNTDYENSLHFSEKFQEYADNLAETLIEKHDIKNKNVIEIGCGKGDFLKTICKKGNNKGTGFDASYEPRKEDKELKDVVFIQEYYTKKHSQYKADMVCCRHVLEHVEKPRRFLAEIKKALNSQEPVFFFEVPNAMYTVREMGIWDIIYEHNSYFTKDSLSFLFQSKGLNVTGMQELFEGQFIGIEAVNNNNASETFNVEGLKEILNHIKKFPEKYNKKVGVWRKELAEAKKKGLKTVIWGTGSKGVTFLNILHVKDEVQYAVDINPRKQGKYIAGTGIKIIPPEKVREVKPDIVIIMNPAYEQEIQKELERLTLKAKVMVA